MSDVFTRVKTKSFIIQAGKHFWPLVSVGYYARVKGIETILSQFLELTKNACQVINLGAGFDTRYWLLKVRINGIL